MNAARRRSGRRCRPPKVLTSVAKPPPEPTTAGVLADEWLEAREKTLGVAPKTHEGIKAWSRPPPGPNRRQDLAALLTGHSDIFGHLADMSAFCPLGQWGGRIGQTDMDIFLS